MERGDSNMRSVWLCSRNDVIGNLAVLLAALGDLKQRFGAAPTFSLPSSWHVSHCRARGSSSALRGLNCNQRTSP
jgi:hypothetical protein